MNREELITAYTVPSRHYHNLTHIEDCLAALARVDNLSEREREILTEAIWWHDVIYDPTRSDNEELSARLAEQRVHGDIGAEVARLIRLTKTHDVRPEDRLGAILISIDLSILGAEPARYDAYAAAIRQEFIHVPDAGYRAGRARVLGQFAARPVILPDPAFAARYDGQARDNLARELGRFALTIT
ncbi:putative metal-dependent HD superfamily phosphohydrolase [Bradyrhizobium sp. AZCC 1588]|uniref:HD domain-containing protein n=1 Tax=unclassified Bradyrhizobium TaxID=2631580 RepID=UPI002FEEB845